MTHRVEFVGRDGLTFLSSDFDAWDDEAARLVAQEALEGHQPGTGARLFAVARQARLRAPALTRVATYRVEPDGQVVELV